MAFTLRYSIFSSSELMVYTHALGSVRRPPFVHNAQTSSSPKLPVQSKPNFVWSLLTKVCSWHLGHMTKMATMPIYGKKIAKIFCSGTGGPISTNLSILHQGLQIIIVCSNDDPGLTLTYFMARSNFVT